MHVSVSRDGKTPEKMVLAQGVTLSGLVKKMVLNDQTFFSKVNGKLVHPATALKDGDKIEFVGIIYGG
ncbi:MoaD/ThiS family protein [Candidatus Micrarchaeota archaeon]|nr:MoaD/ThiS family protein [Candidatus Micrarchaeota archaeon]